MAYHNAIEFHLLIIARMFLPDSKLKIIVFFCYSPFSSVACYYAPVLFANKAFEFVCLSVCVCVSVRVNRVHFIWP